MSITPSEVSETVTFPEVLKLLRCSPTTLRKWIRDRLIPAPVRIGLRKRLWLRAELEAFLAKNREGGAQ